MSEPTDSARPGARLWLFGRVCVALGLGFGAWMIAHMVDCRGPRWVCSNAAGGTTPGAGMDLVFFYLALLCMGALSLLVGGVAVVVGRRRAAAGPGVDVNGLATVALGLGLGGVLLPWPLWIFVPYQGPDERWMALTTLAVCPIAALLAGAVARIKAKRLGVGGRQAWLALILAALTLAPVIFYALGLDGEGALN